MATDVCTLIVRCEAAVAARKTQNECKTGCRVSADASGSVGILNRSAEKLIGHAESETLDHPLSDVLPELDDMMKAAREGTQRLVQGQITISRDGH